MKINVKDYCCTNPECEHYKKFGLRNIGKHSFYNTKRGKFRRLICKTCRVTFSSTKGTVYYKLQKEPKDFNPNFAVKDV